MLGVTRIQRRLTEAIIKQVRFVNTKKISMRITSTKSIRKITASMKMVSASKLRGEMARLATGKPFGAWTDRLVSPIIPIDQIKVADMPAKTLIIAVTSDRGLCGAINSYVSRSVKNLMIEMKKQNKEYKIVALGEKGRSHLRKSAGSDMVFAATDLSLPINYTQICSIVAEVMGGTVHAGGSFDAVTIVFNRFKNSLSYVTSCRTITRMDSNIYGYNAAYSFEPEEMKEFIPCIYEWTIANALYQATMEAAASEQSSRRNAMENASKNAGEMIDKLTLIYNRARQTKITTELIEIISGAAAING